LSIRAKRPSWREAVRPALLFSAGTAAALAPNLFFMALSFDRYYFDNLGYHLLRSDLTPTQSLGHQGQVLRLLLGLTRGAKFESFQFPLLLYLGLASAGMLLWQKRTLDPAFYIAALLFAVSFLPRPVYVQYFAVLVPFLIVCGMYLLHQLAASRKSSPARAAALAAGLLFMALLYFRGVGADIFNYTSSGRGVIGIGGPRNAPNWTLPRVRAITRQIDSAASPGDKVLSFWPGYLLESHAASLPGAENQFGALIAPKLGPKDKKRHKVLSKEDMRRALERREASLAVLQKKELNADWHAALAEGGYRQIRALGNVRIYRLGAVQ
jgi:hypothetical protein